MMKQGIFSNRAEGERKLTMAEVRHRQLEDRLHELDRRALLTPPEQRELTEIKKHKLRAKDEISTLRRALG